MKRRKDCCDDQQFHSRIKYYTKEIESKGQRISSWRHFGLNCQSIRNWMDNHFMTVSLQ